MCENDPRELFKEFGYHPARNFGADVMKSTFLDNVDVEIEYGYTGQVIGIFVRKRRSDD